MRWFRFLMLLPAIAICFAFTGCGGGASSDDIRFGTGGTGGMYYAYGSALAEMISAENPEFKFDVKNTAGSAANLRLLREGFLDLAIVQSDALSDAIQGTGIFVTVGKGSGYAAVAGLYTEACQIIVKKDSPIETVFDLAGRKVSVGEKESGVLQNASEILMAHGLTLEMIEPSYLSFSDSADALECGEIDAFFITAGAPTKAVGELAEKFEIRLLNISPDVLANIMRMYKGYTPCTIPAETYKGQSADTSTIGVKAVLIANTELSEEKIAYITKFVLNNAEKIRQNARSAAVTLDTEYAVKDIPGEFHSGAAKHYKEEHGVEVPVYSGESGKRVQAGQD